LIFLTVSAAEEHTCCDRWMRASWNRTTPPRAW